MFDKKKYIICRSCGTTFEKEEKKTMIMCPVCGKVIDYRHLLIDLNILREGCVWKF